MTGKAVLISLISILYITTPIWGNTRIHIGSKKFTENVILAEILSQMTAHAGFEAEHRKELGGTRILWNALQTGEIDLYPEYTGTIVKEILADRNLPGENRLEEILKESGIGISAPLGFNNTYALGMKKNLAGKRKIRKISDLSAHTDLIFGFTNEFMDRGDGWPGLRRHYNLPQTNVRGLDHDLAYQGLDNGFIEVMDLYSTDAEIRYYDLKVLQDDLAYFPVYNAVILFRLALPEKLISHVSRLCGKLDEEQMIRLNARAKIDKQPERLVAAGFLEKTFNIENHIEHTGFWQRLIKRTKEHLHLVIISLSAAVLLAIPLGILAARISRLEQLILGIVGIIQTIPSLALLVFMIPLLGIGGPPAILALFLYSLLPIVRNTYSGLQNIPLPVRESALALGLPASARLRRIELPMALPSIMAGIKTSAVINVGTATLGALIGAGGYGQPILTGIRLDDVKLILEGAVPAAALALTAQFLFDGLERIMVPRGLRL